MPATNCHAAHARLAQERAARRGGQPVDTGARREEEDAPIFAPGQVRGQLGQQNGIFSINWGKLCAADI